MKVKKVIKSTSLPTKLPIWSTITTALALDYWNAPQWLWGAMGLLFLIGWISCIICFATEEEIDLLKNDPK